MKKLLKTLLAIATIVACLPNAIHGQALPTATKSGDIQAGVAVMSLNNDYSVHKDAGLMIYGDYDLLRFFRIEAGAEAEARFGGLYSPDDIGENSYLVGPRFSVRRANLRIYGKVMLGRGTIFHDSNTNNTSSSFNVIAFGGGVEYRVKRRFNLRADVEDQKWPNFEPHTLSPLALSAGVAYVIR